MSPEFKASVRAYAEALLQKEFGTNGTVITKREHDLISGLVYRFIHRLTVQEELANVEEAVMSAAGGSGRADREIRRCHLNYNLLSFRRSWVNRSSRCVSDRGMLKPNCRMDSDRTCLMM